jgi:transcriptional regulator with XRE-family HTH domain
MTNTNKLKARIKEKGYTQEEVAKKLGRSMVSFNYKINNKREFTADEFLALCKILSIEEPFEYFFAEDVEK